MKAVVYEGPRQVRVKDVPDARIERPTDVLVRITSASICGSDLHMYEGRTDFEQAHEPDGEEQANLTMNRLVASVRFTGKIRNVGVFVPQDPGVNDKLAKQGKLTFDHGMFWFKGQHIGSGQAPVKKYNRQLRDLIAAGKAEPSFSVSHELPLDRAPEAYEHFDKRDEGWTKIVLHPAMARAGA
ncbi:alcohol dehydrogenase catalytic domain-containing protein [Dactylosporangium sp. NPDC000555]|uniref:alcohol dehydrogenase catalytic domain-containing protein n=1 Tax=Dactylosporangium sp. NPDC000555 TaxID=3154260 RepID=UPI0033304C43